MLKTWFLGEANERLYLGGVQPLWSSWLGRTSSAVALSPRKHHELLRAIVAIKTGISYYKIDLKALDSAYSIAFPTSTPINVNKKRKDNVATLQCCS